MHARARYLTNTIGHLHIPAALPSEKEHLVPTTNEAERVRNIGMGVVVMKMFLFHSSYSVVLPFCCLPFLDVCVSSSIKILIYFPLYLPGFHVFPSVV